MIRRCSVSSRMRNRAWRWPSDSRMVIREEAGKIQMNIAKTIRDLNKEKNIIQGETGRDPDVEALKTERMCVLKSLEKTEKRQIELLQERVKKYQKMLLLINLVNLQ